KATASSQKIMNLLLSRPAAIDDKIGSRDKACPFRTKIYRKRAYFFNLAPTSQRDSRDEIFVLLGIAQDGLVHFGGEGSRADSVDCDFVRRQFQRKGSRETQQPSFAGAIGRS